MSSPAPQPPKPQPLAAARAAETAARAVPGVIDLSGGRIGEFATYGGGERVVGVRVRNGPDANVVLRLVVEYGRALPELTDDVRSRVREAVTPYLMRADTTVDIDVVDVTTREAVVAELPTVATATPLTAAGES